MFIPASYRLLASGAGASMLAGCAGSTGLSASPRAAKCSALGSARSALAPLSPQAFAKRADIGPPANALYNVGDHNGSTYAPDGVAVRFRNDARQRCTGETVATNSVFDFQKDGILAFDNVLLAVNSNDVTGAGAVNHIASNGIEMDGVAFTSFRGNRVSLDQYTGPIYGDSGYVVCGDTLGGVPITSKTQVKKNNVAQFNDIEIYVSPNSDCS